MSGAAQIARAVSDDFLGVLHRPGAVDHGRRSALRGTVALVEPQVAQATGAAEESRGVLVLGASEQAPGEEQNHGEHVVRLPLS